MRSRRLYFFLLATACAAGCGNPSPSRGSSTGSGVGVASGASSGGGVGPVTATSGASGNSSGLSCTNACSAGATQCDGALFQSCAKGANGCYAWSQAFPCAGGGSCVGSACSSNPSSASGATSTSGSACTNQCSSDGQTQCDGTQVQICHSAGSCLVWSLPQTCPTGQACGGANDTCVPGGATGTGSSGTATTGGRSSSSGSTGSIGSIGSAGSIGSTGGNCSNQCASGETQCSGSQIQSCGTGSDGCLEWQPAQDCPSGDACDSVLNSCQPVCQVTATEADCNSAANVINGCCSGSFTVTSASLCAAEVSAGRDPDSQCKGLASEGCSALESTYTQLGTCCCPSGQYCNEETSAWTCTPTCSTSASCGGNLVCAPNDDGMGDLLPGPFLCKPNDGQAYHGCVGTTETCSSPYDCWLTIGGQYCTRSCNTNSDCGGAAGDNCCYTGNSSFTPKCENDIETCSSDECNSVESCAGTCAPCDFVN